ncbi:MAG: glycosyltransferase family 39 protein [Solirubrobacteraceae bacterium]
MYSDRRERLTGDQLTTTSDSQAAPAGDSRLIREFTLWQPGWLKRQPRWARLAALLLLLVAASLYIRTRYIGGQFWMDEGITVGISSHPLTAIPGILRYDGSPPLFYLLLHVWMTMVGNGEAATHWLALIFSTLTIPVGYWVGSSIDGRRAGLVSATFFAFNAFLDYYGVETRMYTMMTLWGLLATAGFIRGFVFRERRYVLLFAVSEALMLYTHDWSVYFGAGSFLALVLLYFTGDEQIRENLIKDVVAAFAGAILLFVPWVPTAIYQALHTGAPWDKVPRFGAPVQIAVGVFGGASITVVMLLAAGIGYAPMFNRPHKLSRSARVAMMLLAIPVLTLLCAWVGSHITPAWVVRYFAPIVGPLVLLLAIGVARAGVVGAVAVVFVVAFMARPASFMPQYKSDMQDVAGEMAPMLHPGDLVIVGQPEQTPLAYYYLPGGLRWANTIGPVKDPSYMNWVDAMKRYKAENPDKVLPPLLNALKPGTQVLYIRPLTEGESNWDAPWTIMVRRRSAQYGAIIAADKQLVPETWAPHNYRGACCVADSAVLYKKL